MKTGKSGFAAIGRIQFRNAQCLHCVVVDLANFWVDCGRDEPAVTLMRLSEAIGALVGQIVDPEDRQLARTHIGAMILDISEPTAGSA